MMRRLQPRVWMVTLPCLARREIFQPHLHQGANCPVCAGAGGGGVMNDGREETRHRPEKVVDDPTRQQPTPSSLSVSAGIHPQDAASYRAVREDDTVRNPTWLEDPDGKKVTTEALRREALIAAMRLMQSGESDLSSGAAIEQSDAITEALARFEAAGCKNDVLAADFDVLVEYYDSLVSSNLKGASADVKGNRPVLGEASVAVDTTKQERFHKALESMRDVLHEAGVKFFLCCGTALGVRREQRFIPHDDDIDLGVFYDDLVAAGSGSAAESVTTIISQSSDRFTCIDICGAIDKGLELRFQHADTGVLVDLNVYYSDVDSKTQENFLWTATHYEESAKRKHGMYRYRHAPFALEEVHFGGQEYLQPPVRYLEEYFGSDWKTPKKFNYREGLRGEYKNIIDE